MEVPSPVLDTEQLSFRSAIIDAAKRGDVSQTISLLRELNDAGAKTPTHPRLEPRDYHGHFQTEPRIEIEENASGEREIVHIDWEEQEALEQLVTRWINAIAADQRIIEDIIGTNSSITLMHEPGDEFIRSQGGYAPSRTLVEINPHGYTAIIEKMREVLAGPYTPLPTQASEITSDK